jgi:hypothetical protein
MGIPRNLADEYNSLLEKVKLNIARPYAPTVIALLAQQGLSCTPGELHRVMKGVKKDLPILLALATAAKVPTKAIEKIANNL